MKFKTGIIANKFNSNPIHIEIQFDDEIDIKVLNINNIKNIIFVKFKFIRKKNIILYLKYESKSLSLAYFSYYYYLNK